MLMPGNNSTMEHIMTYFYFSKTPTKKNSLANKVLLAEFTA
jgi:hypothetical protein